MVPGKPDSYAGRRAKVASREIQAIGRGAGFEYQIGEIEPPCSKAEAFERFRLFRATQCGFVRFTRFGPRAARECPVSFDALVRSW